MPNIQKPHMEHCCPHIVYKFEITLAISHQQPTLLTHVLRILREITKDHTLSSWHVYDEENIVVTLKFSGHIGSVHNGNIQYGFRNMNTGVHSKQF